VVFSEKSGPLAAVRVGVQNRRREARARKELRAAELAEVVRRGRGRARLKGEYLQTYDQRACAESSLKTTQLRFNFVMVFALVPLLMTD
jgi:hypothetical protein